MRIFVGLAVLIWLFWRGNQRRRHVWTDASWNRFFAIIAVILGAFLVSMAMAFGVDNGIYGVMPHWLKRPYFYLLMALTFASPLTFVGLAIWFAHGRADKQLIRTPAAPVPNEELKPTASPSSLVVFTNECAAAFCEAAPRVKC